MTTRKRAVRKSTPAVVRQAEAPVAETIEPEHQDGPTRSQIRDKVLKYIEGQQGVTVYCDDIAKDLGANRNSVQSAVRGLQERLPQIVTVVSGKAWRWNENAKPGTGKRLYEELITTKAGVVLVQDEDGNVYPLGEMM